MSCQLGHLKDYIDAGHNFDSGIGANIPAVSQSPKSLKPIKMTLLIPFCLKKYWEYIGYKTKFLKICNSITKKQVGKFSWIIWYNSCIM